MIFFISCALGVGAKAILVGRTLVTMEVRVLPLFDFEEDDCLPLVNVCFTFFFGGIVILLSQLLLSSSLFRCCCNHSNAEWRQKKSVTKRKGGEKTTPQKIVTERGEKVSKRKIPQKAEIKSYTTMTTGGIGRIEESSFPNKKNSEF
jgi:hypothetical protein